MNQLIREATVQLIDHPFEEWKKGTLDKWVKTIQDSTVAFDKMTKTMISLDSILGGPRQMELFDGYLGS